MYPIEIRAKIKNERGKNSGSDSNVNIIFRKTINTMATELQVRPIRKVLIRLSVLAMSES
jgi:hypothetical protein